MFVSLTTLSSPIKYIIQAEQQILTNKYKDVSPGSTIGLKEWMMKSITVSHLSSLPAKVHLVSCDAKNKKSRMKFGLTCNCLGLYR